MNKRIMFILTFCLFLSGCGSYSNTALTDEEIEAKLSKIDELERKINTQSLRLNQMSTVQDSLKNFQSIKTETKYVSANMPYRKVLNEWEVGFDLNDYNLDKIDQDILNDIASWMSEYPTSLLQVTGHTDKTGNAFYNEQLSRQRADAALRYLMDKHDVPLYRMEALGFGYSKSKYHGENKSRNRRINLVLVLPYANESD